MSWFGHMNFNHYADHASIWHDHAFIHQSTGREELVRIITVNQIKSDSADGHRIYHDMANIQTRIQVMFLEFYLWKNKLKGKFLFSLQ